MTRIKRSHTITLPLPTAEALPLFTPRGEMDWIAEWKPQFVHPASGEIEASQVFRTGAGDDLTLWSVTDWEPWRGRVRYARVTPASRFGFVEVEVRGRCGWGKISGRAYGRRVRGDDRGMARNDPRPSRAARLTALAF